MSTTPVLPVVLIAAGRDRSPVRVLGTNEYTLVEAATGARALERARQTRPDIVLLDAELPDLTGLEACRLFRGEPHIGRNIPILLISSGPATPDQRVAALRAGIWDFVRFPGDPDDLALKVEIYLQAKRNIDASLEEGLVDPATGLHSRPGLARRARELGALMARHHGALACIVFAVEPQANGPRAASLVAQTARVCDVVGALAPGEYAVLAPGTTDAGVVRLAQRVAAALASAPWAGSASSATRPGAGLLVGYDAVANLKYSPIDPVALLGRAASAVRNGRPEPGLVWVRRFDVGAEESRGAARQTPPGLVLEDQGRGRS